MGMKDVAVHCRITRSGFPSERVFRIVTADQVEFVGAAPRDYFYGVDRKQLDPKLPEKGASVSGFVAARVLEEFSAAGTMLVSVPSGDVISIDKALVVEASEKSPNVSFQP